MSIPIIVSALALGGSLVLQTGCAGGPLRRSTGEYVDDAALSTRVRAAMVRDPIVSALDVSVETFRGTVQLSGFVNTPEEKARAEQIASGVAGVQSVQNTISVKTGQAPGTQPAASQPPPGTQQPPPPR